MNAQNPHLLDVLTREGVLLSVSVRFWRGCKRLKAEDIGLESSALSERLISLGHKRLLPKEATAGTVKGERVYPIYAASTFRSERPGSFTQRPVGRSDREN